MYPTLKHCSLVAFENDVATRCERRARASARALQRAAQAGTTQPLLRGKNLGLLCEVDDDADAALFRRAAVELGAHVAHIRPRLSELSTPEEVQHTARMLGRLYDAVECQGMAPALVQQVGNDAGVPVYDGIASQDHPTAQLAESLGDERIAGRQPALRAAGGSAEHDRLERPNEHPPSRSAAGAEVDRCRRRVGPCRQRGRHRVAQPARRPLRRADLRRESQARHARRRCRVRAPSRPAASARPRRAVHTARHRAGPDRRTGPARHARRHRHDGGPERRAEAGDARRRPAACAARAGPQLPRTAERRTSA